MSNCNPPHIATDATFDEAAAAKKQILIRATRLGAVTKLRQCQHRQNPQLDNPSKRNFLP